MKYDKPIRINDKFRMIKRVVKPRGKGSRFQWNCHHAFVIIYPDKSEKIFDTRTQAEKEWVYVLLKH